MMLGLQEILYKKLNIDIINKYVKGIFYYVPPNSPFPYIYIGDFLNKDRSTKSHKINDIRFKIFLFTRDKSLKEALRISKTIQTILSSEKEQIINLIDEKINLQNDGITGQIILSFRAIIGENYDI